MNTMVRFGVIGTNWITDRFLDAGRQVEDFELTAVYSRTEEKAKAFASKYQVVTTFTDLSELAESSVVDAVYIASPTSLHAEQAITCMKKGKHVFVEKPIASNQIELNRMIKVAKENDVLLMEGVKTTHLPNFQVLKDQIDQIGPVRRYFGNYCQYSSRYDKYKAGIVLNAFKPEFSNGSLMDIGIYTAYPMVALFGAPDQVQTSVYMLESGVDGQGTITVDYPSLNGVLFFSKITNSNVPSEIQGENGTLVIENLSDLQRITHIDRDGKMADLTVEQKENTMYYEVEHFVHLIKNGKKESPVNSLALSLATIELLDQARKQAGVRFPADQQET